MRIFITIVILSIFYNLNAQRSIGGGTPINVSGGITREELTDSTSAVRNDFPPNNSILSNNLIVLNNYSEVSSITATDTTLVFVASDNSYYKKYTGSDISDNYVIRNGANTTKFEKIFDKKNGVSPLWFGNVELGILSEKYPNDTYDELSRKRIENWACFKRACNYAIEHSLELIIPSDTIEIDPYVSSLSATPLILGGSVPNGQITISIGKTLRIKGTDKNKSVIKLYPIIKYKNVSGTDGTILFRVLRGGNLYLDNATFIGRSTRQQFERYNVVLKYLAPNAIKIADTVSLRSNFWATLSVGDTIVYTGNNYSTISYQGIVNTKDSVTRVITLTTNLNASISNNTELSGSYIFRNWTPTTPIDTITQYSGYLSEWAYPDYLAYGFGYTYNETNILPNNGTSDRGIINVSNLNVYNFTGQFVLSGGWMDGVFENIYSCGTESGVISRFVGDYLNYSTVTLNNVEIEQGGLLASAQYNGVDDGAYGGMMYFHTTVPTTILNSYFHDNNAAMFRQYSSTSISNKPRPNTKTIIKNSIFSNNNQYALLPSGNIPTEIYDCSFLCGTIYSNAIRMDGNAYGVKFFNTYINNPVSLQNTEWYNCVFDSMGVVETATRGIFDNCTFVIDSMRTFEFGSYSDSKIVMYPYNNGIALNEYNFNNCTVIAKNKTPLQNVLRIKESDNYTNTTYVDIKGDFTIFGNNNTNDMVFFNNQNNTNIGPPYINSNIKIKGQVYRYGQATSYQNPNTYYNNTPNRHRAGNAYKISEFKDTSIVVTPSTIQPCGSGATLTNWIRTEGGASDIYINKGTVKGLTFYPKNGDFCFNSNFIGKIRLVAIDTVNIITTDTDPLSNIIGRGLTLLPNESIMVKGNGEFQLGSTEADTLSIFTGDGIINAYNYTPGGWSQRNNGWVPGTLKLYIGGILIQDIGIDGNILKSPETVGGYINHLYRAVSLRFPVPPAIGAEVKLIGKKYITGNYAGFISIIN